MSHKSSTKATELAGLRGAFQYILKQSANQWAVFTDSRSALESLKSLPKEQLAWEINLLHFQAIQRGHSVGLQWLPGHCGVAGNDAADKAASSAHSLCTEAVSIPFTRKDAAILASSTAWNVQMSIWTDARQQYAPLHEIDPKCTFRMPPGLSKREEAILHRLRLNVAYTGHYLYKIQQASSPLCSRCDSREDIHHVICVCPKYTVHRQKLILSLCRQLGAGLELRAVLGPWSGPSQAARAIKAILEFLRNTDLDSVL